MKIINAQWEKRNLGLDTYEIEFEKSDILSDVEQEFQALSAPYMVVKVPSERNDISEFVQRVGFFYIEDLIHVEHDLHETKRSLLHQRLYDATSYREMTEKDVVVLRDEIIRGMFDSDRISKDVRFGKKISAKRYLNWLDDLLEQGAKPYVILYKEDAAGFIVLQTKDGVKYSSVLGGGYEKYRNSGLGLVQKEQEIVKKLGGKKVTTSVSSNNPSQVRALMLNGYIPVGIDHVFIKHNQVHTM
jgi:hypothetical protein